MSIDYIIGVDLGGTQLRAALADANGTIHTEVRIPTLASEGPEAVIDRTVGVIERVRAAAPADSRVLGVGVGAPGPLDPELGVVFTLPNLPGWSNVPLRTILSERVGLRVALGNDANVAALGEWRFGGGKGRRNVVYITISTGIGAGVIEQNRLVLGYKGAAAELGHMLISSEGTWEELASGTALARAAARAMRDDPHTALHRVATPASVSAANVARTAAQGDALARQLMERESELIGVGLVNTLHLFSPEVILLGGSVITSNPWLLQRASEIVHERTIAQIYRDVPIGVAQLGDQVGVLGAVALYLYEAA